MTAIPILRVLERVHGHLGWLAAVALVHPAILLRNPARRARLSAILATAAATAAAALGAGIYPAYRRQIKQHLFIESPTLGWLFERKEHLAVAVVAFAWVGCLTHCAAAWFPTRELTTTMRRTAHRAYCIAAAFAVAVALLGVAVASKRSF